MIIIHVRFILLMIKKNKRKNCSMSRTACKDSFSQNHSATNRQVTEVTCAEEDNVVSEMDRIMQHIQNLSLQGESESLLQERILRLSFPPVLETLKFSLDENRTQWEVPFRDMEWNGIQWKDGVMTIPWHVSSKTSSPQQQQQQQQQEKTNETKTQASLESSPIIMEQVLRFFQYILLARRDYAKQKDRFVPDHGKASRCIGRAIRHLQDAIEELDRARMIEEQTSFNEEKPFKPTHRQSHANLVSPPLSSKRTCTITTFVSTFL